MTFRNYFAVGRCRKISSKPVHIRGQMIGARFHEFVQKPYRDRVIADAVSAMSRRTVPQKYSMLDEKILSDELRGRRRAACHTQLRNVTNMRLLKREIKQKDSLTPAARGSNFLALPHK